MNKLGTAVSLSILVSACAPTDHRVIMGELNAVFARMPHQCVPLGWNPIPVTTGLYYSGESVELRQESVWLPALWIGRVRYSELGDPQIRVTYAVMNELARIDMLQRLRKPGGFEYHLNLKSLPYYYEESHFRNDPDALPYLCYSTITPQHILWNQQVHTEDSSEGKRQVFRAAFQWHASEAAAWSRDAFLRAHSVTLAPTRSPTIAKFAYVDGNWVVSTIYAREIPLPRLADVWAWPHQQQQ